MAEYIERENLFKFLTEQMTRKQNGAFAKGFNKGIMVARAAVHNKEITPSADVVEVVRCRDCKYYKNGKHFTDIKFCQRLPYYAEKGGLNTADNDYCSYGERRSEE